jgi:hypothetical protein
MIYILNYCNVPELLNTGIPIFFIAAINSATVAMDGVYP